MRVAVNAAPVQLRRRDFASKVIEASARLEAHPGWGLDIEITEGALLDDKSWTLRTLRVLRGAGVRIAIDDFGTGYSSLSRLSQLPVDTLKIDRSFTSRLPDDAAGCTLAATVIGLARAFSMTTVAEGVETLGQLEFLQRAGCTESQGYLHSRPIAAGDLELLLSHPGDLRGGPSRSRSALTFPSGSPRDGDLPPQARAVNWGARAPQAMMARRSLIGFPRSFPKAQS
jgi:EAL domain-containing protein (putative c-di-GMP-specific phosphodiesterase class I)